MPKNYGQYPEFLPSLEGWDFRINLPHTRFQLARSGTGSGPAMIGVIEDAANLYEDPNATVPIVKDYGHRNNSIWMFRVSATDGQIYAKILPSRRDVNGSVTENVRSLTTGWIRVGPPGGRRYKDEAPAAVAIGKGLGSATIYIVARAETDNGLYMSKHVVSTTSFVSWPESWTKRSTESLRSRRGRQPQARGSTYGCSILPMAPGMAACQPVPRRSGGRSLSGMVLC
jgi:hypothetical protein